METNQNILGSAIDQLKTMKTTDILVTALEAIQSELEDLKQEIRD